MFLVALDARARALIDQEPRARAAGPLRILPEYSDLFGSAGRAFLTGLQLPDGPRRRLDSLLSLIDDFDREITRATP